MDSRYLLLRNVHTHAQGALPSAPNQDQVLGAMELRLNNREYSDDKSRRRPRGAGHGRKDIKTKSHASFLSRARHAAAGKDLYTSHPDVTPRSESECRRYGWSKTSLPKVTTPRKLTRNPSRTSRSYPCQTG